MYLYVCVFKDEKYLKIGICENFNRVAMLSGVYKFDEHKMILIRSKNSSLIRLLEKILLSITLKYCPESLEEYKSNKSNIGLSEVRLASALSIIEETLLMFCSHHLKHLEFIRFVEEICSHCQNRIWKCTNVELEQVMITKTKPFIVNIKRNIED